MSDAMEVAQAWVKKTFRITDDADVNALLNVEARWIAESVAGLISSERERVREGDAYIAETFAPPDDTYPMTPYGVCQEIARAIRSSSPKADTTEEK